MENSIDSYDAIRLGTVKGLRAGVNNLSPFTFSPLAYGSKYWLLPPDFGVSLASREKAES
jgi:hypothetical protein